MSNPITLTIAGVDMSNDMEWSITLEEVLGGVGRYQLVVQDRTNAWVPPEHADVKVVITSSGWVLGRGAIISAPLELPVGFPWRRWQIDCADYNYELDWRLVGAPDGAVFVDSANTGNYVAVDPYAVTVGDDAQTVAAWFDRYFRLADGTAVDTATYVQTYLAAGTFSTQYPSYSTLKRALDDLASLVTSNVQHWLDPDLKEHWQAIPSWSELPPGTGGAAPLLRLIAAFPFSQLQAAPKNLSDTPDGSTSIGFGSLKVQYDGGAMPQQVYVRGGTGFVYNNGVDPFAEPVVAPGAVAPTTYLVQINAPTRHYTTLSTGYINPTFVGMYGPGGPYHVVLVVVPWNPALHSGHTPGGHFWKLLDGPHAGLYLDNDTNFFGYGDITITPVVPPPPAPGAPPPPPTPPSIGVGGSGWTNTVTQDPTQRQAYLDFPGSVDQPTRDSVGGQALYRGATPTLRGSVIVRSSSDNAPYWSGADGWRAGQVFTLTDARLPAELNGRTFIIQRVGMGKLFPGTDVREYTLDFGDGPVARSSAQARPKAATPPPANKFVVKNPKATPRTSTTQPIEAQFTSPNNTPIKVPDKVVDWTLEVTDAVTDAVVTGQGSLTPTQSVTDREGIARTTLNHGDQSNLIYRVTASNAVV